MCVYVCICPCMCMHMCLHVCLHLCVHVYAYVCFCMCVCVCVCCTHLHIFMGGISFLTVMPLLHRSAGQCWMKQLLSFLFFAIMIVSCSPIYFCQVFLHAINLSHLCTRSVSYSFFFFHSAWSRVWTFIRLVLIPNAALEGREYMFVIHPALKHTQMSARCRVVPAPCGTLMPFLHPV